MFKTTNQIQNEHDCKSLVNYEKALADYSQYSIKTADIKSLSDKVVNMIAKSLKIDFCNVLEHVPESNCFILKSGAGWNRAIAENTVIDVGDNSLSKYTVMNKKAVIAENLHTDKRFHVSWLLKNHGITSCITVNINDGKNLFGVLGVYSAKKLKFTECDIYFLSAMANILAMSINYATLQNRHKVLSKATEQCTNIVMITDTNGKINYINHKYLDRTDYYEKEILDGKIDIFELNRTQPYVFDHLLKGINSANHAAKGFDHNKSGKIQCLAEVKVSPLKDKEGVVTNFLVVKNNISLLKQKEVKR